MPACAGGRDARRDRREALGLPDLGHEGAEGAGGSGSGDEREERGSEITTVPVITRLQKKPDVKQGIVSTYTRLCESLSLSPPGA